MGEKAGLSGGWPARSIAATAFSAGFAECDGHSGQAPEHFHPDFHESRRALRNGHAIGVFPASLVKKCLEAAIYGGPVKHGACLTAQQNRMAIIPAVFIGAEKITARTWEKPLPCGGGIRGGLGRIRMLAQAPVIPVVIVGGEKHSNPLGALRTNTPRHLLRPADRPAAAGRRRCGDPRL